MVAKPTRLARRARKAKTRRNGIMRMQIEIAHDHLNRLALVVIVRMFVIPTYVRAFIRGISASSTVQ